MIQKRAAVRIRRQGPADRVLHEARLALVLRDLPDLFHAEPELLRVAVLPQIKNGHDFFAAGTAGPFREQRLLGQELHAGLVVLSPAPVLVQADVPRSYSSNTSIAIVQHFCCGESWIYFYT